VGADPGARWIRYVLIVFDSKETNRLITGVETTFREVTVDSPPFKWKNKLGTRTAMLCERRQSRADINIARVASTPALRITAKLPVSRAAASIESP
jgi:hypothetical protein